MEEWGQCAIPFGRDHASRERSHSPRGEVANTLRRSVFFTRPLAHQKKPYGNVRLFLFYACLAVYGLNHRMPRQHLSGMGIKIAHGVGHQAEGELRHVLGTFLTSVGQQSLIRPTPPATQ